MTLQQSSTRQESYMSSWRRVSSATGASGHLYKTYLDKQLLNVESQPVMRSKNNQRQRSMGGHLCTRNQRNLKTSQGQW